MENILSVNKAICKEVIITNLLTRGDGTKNNPYRTVVQIYDKDGELIAENDSNDEHCINDNLISFAKWVIKNKISINNIDNETLLQWKKQAFPMTAHYYNPNQCSQ